MNGTFLSGTNESTGNGFLWSNLAGSVYAKNMSTNTLPNWSLFTSSIPFEDQAKEKLKSALILKKSQTQDVVINKTSQKIATGSETFPTIQWAETAGRLLKVNPDAKIGSYQGEVTWLLSDVP